MAVRQHLVQAAQVLAVKETRVETVQARQTTFVAQLVVAVLVLLVLLA